MYFGSAWYPEHWSEQRWPEDIALMRAAGMNVCRIGEFAWSTMEPHEGSYEFGWLERAVELLHNNGIAVVLGTPTAAPPAWLTHHHPDTLATESNGRPAQHGNRCHFNPGSVTYLRYVRRIVEQMARRFGQDSRVIGWQVDNEYNRVDYSEDTGRRFQAYLREQFGTLDSLNSRWSTAYWSQTYNDWSEIPIPIGPHNPGLMLAFRRFVTRVWRDYQHIQIEAIRTAARPDQWITHNFMGWFDGFDHYTVSKDLDFASWDWYVGSGHHRYIDSAAVHALTRGFKRRNFWVMETQPGCVNWSANNNMLNRGEARCMAWHAVAHGADALLYWQWRSASGGQEQLHGSLIGADGNPRPFYSEAAQIGSEFESLGERLAGTEPQNSVALLHSYDSRWSVNAQKHNNAFDPVEILRRFSRPLTEANIGFDIIEPETPLDQFKLVIAPALVILTDAAADNLTRFVASGGTLALGVRCCQKDCDNALLSSLQPGRLRELAGAEVEEYFALEEVVPVNCFWSADAPQQAAGDTWAEQLNVLSASTEALAVYGPSNGWLDGGPAVTLNHSGQNGGNVMMIGALLGEEAQRSLTRKLTELAGVMPVWPNIIPGVEFAERRSPDSGKRVLFVINHTQEMQTVEVPAGTVTYSDLIGGESITNELKLGPYGVGVLVDAQTSR